jgi:hypothetical protein
MSLVVLDTDVLTLYQFGDPVVVQPVNSSSTLTTATHNSDSRPRRVVGMNLLLVEAVDTNKIGEVRGGTSGSGCASAESSVKNILIEAFD